MALARGWKVLFVTAIAVFLVSLDVTVVNIAFPALVADFSSATPSSLSWVLSAYNIAFAACLLAAGRLADRFGRRRVFFSGLAVFVVGSALCGVAPSPAFLVAARTVQAVGGALLTPASLALVLPEFPVDRRSAAIGVWASIGAIAAATGPSLGSVIVDSVGWRWVFFVNAPVALVAFVAGRRILVESRDDSARSLPDILGAAMATAAVGLLALGIVEGRDWGYSSAPVAGAFAGAALLLPAFLLRSRRHPSPILDLTLFRHRFFAVANAAVFLFSLGFFAMLFVNVLFLTGVWGYSAVAAGLAMTPGPLCAAAASAPAGRLADRVGHRFVAAPAAVLFGTGMVLLATQVDAQSSYWSTMLPAQLVTGIGVGMTFATIGSAANAFLPPARFAMGSAFNATCRQVGAALGVAVAVAVLGEPATGDAVAAFHRTWALLAVFGLASGALMLVFYRRPTDDTAPAPVPAPLAIAEA